MLWGGCDIKRRKPSRCHFKNLAYGILKNKYPWEYILFF
jgi:hypothetical protein